MTMIRNQRGMTFLGVLLLLGLLGFLTLIALRLMPGYMEYYTVAQAMEQVKNETTPETSPGDVRKALGRRFMVNDVKSVRPEDFNITRADGKTTISIYYEFRTPVMANVDAVIVFEKSVETGGS